MWTIVFVLLIDTELTLVLLGRCFVMLHGILESRVCRHGVTLSVGSIHQTRFDLSSTHLRDFLA